MAASAGGGLVTSETGVGAAAGFVGVQTGLGVAVGGVAKIVTAAAGIDSKQVDQGIQAAQTLSNPAGLVTTIAARALGASPQSALTAGDKGAAAANLVTTIANLPQLATGNTLEKTTEGLSVLQSGADAKKVVCHEQTSCGQPATTSGTPAKPGGGN